MQYAKKCSQFFNKMSSYYNDREYKLSIIYNKPYIITQMVIKMFSNCIKFNNNIIK
jgi:hypothetical protein